MNAKDAWIATLGQLQVQLSRSIYDTWLRRVELSHYEDGRFTVTVPTEYARDWIERHLLESMTQTLSSIFRRPAQIELIVWEPPTTQSFDEPLFTYQSAQHSGSPLNPAYRLETFISGEPNRYAYLLATSIAEGQIGRHSPALFVGSLGNGKTHLLQAIAHALLERNCNALYLTAEAFTTALVESIREGTNSAFREKFRNADALLIDDAQFIEGKDSTQAELVAIWDIFRSRQRQIVFAADRLPSEMTRLSGDLRSRLQAGPMARLEAPDLELRRLILAEKSKARGLKLPKDVLELLATRLTTNVRDLESAVDQLNTYSTLTAQSVSRELAQMILRALGAEQMRLERTSLERVMSVVAAHYRLSVRDLASRKRTKGIALARQMAMYVARELSDASLAQIGAALGRNHSTVAHGCAKIAEQIALDSALRADFEAICGALAGKSALNSAAAPALARR
ncbi:MAG: chromosomal replication initiator protein DnaA [Candidatus Thermofonsia Clade 1 bacterium]|jgi:chromosomal replication initiator protein|uniref:Chromosomal replication initiator protein DnaA n=1 Tax=Candidatus Thermofonsia Clade 1 bacterium TaxID=2364210 RepID=A0A2M8PX86_9CHLR|nr:MAG: chromosomal replication initiator protein DnaA [Candidatus Thermofonsia Clade 1 bacterium]PJF42151.1 MAG: chromosomal replication initiator protein DnaA [Candidatus Thermofonsia Clade 1 bacterium]RMF50073.1 MAG: chromosomal replication initiator protein DnaA [Chloroflexota bacterium]